MLKEDDLILYYPGWPMREQCSFIHKDSMYFERPTQSNKISIILNLHFNPEAKITPSVQRYLILLTRSAQKVFDVSPKF